MSVSPPLHVLFSIGPGPWNLVRVFLLVVFVLMFRFFGFVLIVVVIVSFCNFFTNHSGFSQIPSLVFLLYIYIYIYMCMHIYIYIYIYIIWFVKWTYKQNWKMKLKDKTHVCVPSVACVVRYWTRTVEFGPRFLFVVFVLMFRFFGFLRVVFVIVSSCSFFTKHLGFLKFRA